MVIVLAVLGGLLLLGLATITVPPVEAPTSDELVAELERALARSGRPVAAGVTLASLERRFRTSPDAVGYLRAIRDTRFAGAAQLPTVAQRRALRAELRFGLGFAGRVRALWALPPRPGRRVAVRIPSWRGLHSRG